MTDTEGLEARLAEADTALHQLMLGKKVVSVDYDGAATTFSKANEGQLRRYIRSLKRELGLPLTNSGSRRVSF